MNGKNRLLNADLIRVIAMFMVIFLHTILNFTIRADFFVTKLYFLLEPIAAISKTCVLLFFMLSGFLVISKNRTIKENLKKTSLKILLPLGFFTLVNIFYAWTKFSYNGSNGNQFISDQLHRMIRFPSSPLWFLVVLFFLYFLNPFWQLIFSKSKNLKLARFLTASTLIFSLASAIIEHSVGKLDAISTNLTAWTSFVFFYLYGGLVRNKWIKINNQKLNLSLIGLGFTLTVLGDFFSMQQEIINSSFFIWSNYTSSYLSIPVTMMAIGIFNFVLSINLSNFKFPVLAWISNLSFGIYLIHIYVVSMLTDVIGFDFNRMQINVYLYNLLNVLLVFSISMMLTLFLKRIPKVKAIIGG